MISANEYIVDHPQELEKLVFSGGNPRVKQGAAACAAAACAAARAALAAESQHGEDGPEAGDAAHRQALRCAFGIHLSPHLL